MGDSSDTDKDSEVAEVKRAMREARARKKSIETKFKQKWESDALGKLETDAMLRQTQLELESLRKRIKEYELEIKESKYDFNRLNSQLDSLKHEKELAEALHRNQMLQIQKDMETMTKKQTERNQVIANENKKVQKVVDKLLSNMSSQIQSGNVGKTHLHLLQNASLSLKRLNAFISSVDNCNEIKEISSMNLTESLNDSQAVSVDVAVDSALLDMCNNLEEENASLMKTIEVLKSQLQDSKREASSSQLIPHYRLAIMRSRTYSLNLIEQLKREQETTSDLRTQLEETYQDLKKVVDEKRKLYKKLNKISLQQEEIELKSSIDFIPTTVHGQRTHKSDLGHSTQVTACVSEKDQVKAPKERSNQQYTSTAPEYSFGTLRKGADTENNLKSEIITLDQQIELLKDKLGKAALVQSQKILSEVIDSSLSKIPISS